MLRSASQPDLSPAPRAPAVGVGLKPQHYGEIVETGPALGWFEIHPENYMFEGGPPHHYLERIRRDYPLSLHSVGCSLGSADPIEAEQLAWMTQLTERYQPFLISDHVSWSAVDGAFLNDLLPLPYTDESLRAIAANVDRLQTALGRQILVENPSTYLQFNNDALTEPEFLRELTARTGCGLLLDINNAYVCASNHGFDIWAYLAALPHDAVQEIHLAGHAVEQVGDVEIRIDDHGDVVCEAVWALYHRYTKTYGAAVTLIEWDTNVPDFATLMAEADRARDITAMEGRHAGTA
ncbi:MAG: DUF692 family multinuclear iron-containing protein [Alphaproteobacteria bacterium]